MRLTSVPAKMTTLEKVAAHRECHAEHRGSFSDPAVVAGHQSSLSLFWPHMELCSSPATRGHNITGT